MNLNRLEQVPCAITLAGVFFAISCEATNTVCGATPALTLFR
jgi:hypothetical protein